MAGQFEGIETKDLREWAERLYDEMVAGDATAWEQYDPIVQEIIRREDIALGPLPVFSTKPVE